ncbi:restriction endonuclease subunit S domain-containing protein [Methanobrevibacter sp.]
MMNMDEFLKKIVGSEYQIKNLSFHEDTKEFISLISNFKSKLAIAISSSFFHSNIQLFSNIKNINNIKSIYSLPIYKGSSNIILLSLDPNKNLENFILIDESDALLHKADSDNISQELADELIKIFKQSDNEISLNLNSIFQNISTLETINETDELLSLYVDDDLEGFNKKTDAEVVKDFTSGLTGREAELFKEKKEKLMYTNQVDSSSNMEKINFSSSNFIKESAYLKKRPNPKNMLEKNNKPLIEGKVNFRKLEDIVSLNNTDKKNNDTILLISSSKNCDNRLVYYNKDWNDVSKQQFIEITNISKDVSADYLYEYLNSDYGRDELLYYSDGNDYISAELIASIQIPIPSLDIQNEIVKTSREAREFFKTVDLLKKEFNSNILDYKHISQSLKDLKGEIEIDSQTSVVNKLSRSWRQAYQGLIWPLAISYLSATKGGFEIVEKKDNYLKLFEFTAAFNAIILLSGLPEDVYLKNFNKIWDDETLKQYKTSMTFGKWIYISRNLAEVYNNNNFTSSLDEEFFEKITSYEILYALNEVKNIRNREFHDAMSNVYDAEKTIEILDEYLEDVFDILEIYTNYKLIYTTGHIECKDNNFIHEIILLNGPCAQPIYDRIIFDNCLKEKSLYLYNPKNNKKLLIKDSFMKFVPLDNRRKHWALYIYNNCDKYEKNAFYKCFQSKERNYKQIISSFKDDILLNF